MTLKSAKKFTFLRLPPQLLPDQVGFFMFDFPNIAMRARNHLC